MLKKISFFALVALAAASCNIKETRPDCLTPVTVHVSEFAISMKDLPTKTVIEARDYAEVKALTLAIFSGNTEVCQSTQLKTEAGDAFGTFTCSLPQGTYTLVVVGRGHFDGDVFSLSSPTSAGYTSDRARETFCATQEVSVTSSAPLDLSVSMDRVVALLNLVSTDPRPAGVAKIRTIYAKGSKSFNPTTGLASDNNGLTVVNTPSAAVGTTINTGSYLFLASDGENPVNITLQTLDEDDNVLMTRLIPNVPLMRNRKTILTGPLFTASATSTIKLENAWETSNTVTF